MCMVGAVSTDSIALGREDLGRTERRSVGEWHSLAQGAAGRRTERHENQSIRATAWTLRSKGSMSYYRTTRAVGVADSHVLRGILAAAGAVTLIGCGGTTSNHTQGGGGSGGESSADPGKDSGIAGAEAAPNVPPPDARDSPPPEQPTNCILSNTSTIPHVRVEFPSQPCAFTLRQAEGGIRFRYDVVIDEDVPGYTSRTSNSGVLMYPGESVANLQVAAVVQGGTQRYCVCDQGGPPRFCPLEDGGVSYRNFDTPCTPITLKKGTHHESWPSSYEGPIAWHGRNWDGPSDTGNPEGAPFPPGDYTLKIAIAGQITDDGGTTDVDVDAEFLVRLVP
jgi:hypothetical protein